MIKSQVSPLFVTGWLLIHLATWYPQFVDLLVHSSFNKLPEEPLLCARSVQGTSVMGESFRCCLLKKMTCQERNSSAINFTIEKCYVESRGDDLEKAFLH